MKSRNQTLIRNTKHSEQDLQITQQEALFSGPIPHPDLLEGYKRIDQSYPERILQMAEKHADADVFMEKEAAKSVSRGQVFSFILCIIGFCVAVLLAVMKLEAVAITAAIGGVSPIIISAIVNNKK